jgi:hypothetical protein
MRKLTCRLALAGTVALLAAGGASSANQTFADPTGDASGAPDITTVAVHSDSTAVTLRIDTTSASAWSDAAAILAIDTDLSPGPELTYVLHSLHDKFTLDRSSGEHVEHPAATASLSGAALTIAIPLSELGSSPRIGFRVSTPGPAGEDFAPDRSLPEWQFALVATVRSISAAFAPSRPVHGKVFAVTRVTALLSDGTTAAAAATCSAKLGRAPLAGACRWRIPATAAGRTLTVVVTARGTRKPYSFRVR